jgi:hypothetical protein
VFENKVRRAILGPTREVIIGGWGKFHNGEIHIYFSHNTIRVIETRRVTWAGQVTCVGMIKNAFQLLIWKPQWRNPFGISISKRG